jgi:hypothetical protein
MVNTWLDCFKMKGTQLFQILNHLMFPFLIPAQLKTHLKKLWSSISLKRIHNYISSINQAKSLKKRIIACGCVPQAERNLREFANVSLLGITQIDRVVEVVEETLRGNIVRLLHRKELPSLSLPKIRRNNLIEM